jgi:hypothetical protein
MRSRENRASVRADVFDFAERMAVTVALFAGTRTALYSSRPAVQRIPVADAFLRPATQMCTESHDKPGEPSRKDEVVLLSSI